MLVPMCLLGDGSLLSTQLGDLVIYDIIGSCHDQKDFFYLKASIML